MRTPGRRAVRTTTVRTTMTKRSDSSASTTSGTAGGPGPRPRSSPRTGVSDTPPSSAASSASTGASVVRRRTADLVTRPRSSISGVRGGERGRTPGSHPSREVPNPVLFPSPDQSAIDTYGPRAAAESAQTENPDCVGSDRLRKKQGPVHGGPPSVKTYTLAQSSGGPLK